MSQQGSASRALQGSHDLGRLKRGEIDIDQYLELRLEEQLERLPLRGSLSPSDIEALRQVLRAHFQTDPVLRHYLDAALDAE